MDLDVIQSGVGRRPGPAAAQERDFVSQSGKAAEDFVHVNLGSAGLRILAVLPVDEQYAHVPYRAERW
jgi:hypothetical protein